ncbi:hypothetical protein [Paenibacillus urinalis]|uniref:Oligosaccharide repeat unit polymerase n=1 Tax=Paenibacillus urinalis TaxID=521520 RepID=A0AAX3N4Y8_9BACL|nr:hypothetical protein [Paenibacillus urinalis]WDH83790.1 hypothetical protein PUW23_06065 [Paenibacillus urinalis]
MYLLTLILLLISLTTMFILPLKLDINKYVRVIVLFMAFGELFGIVGKVIIIILGLDKVREGLSYYMPTDEQLSYAMLCLALFNIFFILGINFICIQAKVMKRTLNHKQTNSTSIITNTPSENSIKYLLLILSSPGLILLLINILQGNTLISNSQLEATRIDVAGTGPIIILKEIPLSALLVWFSYKNSKVTIKWWLGLIGVLSMFLLTGNRSAMVMAVIVLMAIVIQIFGIKRIFKKLHLYIIPSVLSIYIGWLVIFVRGNLLKTNNSFIGAIQESFNYDLSYMITYLYRTSFNGFDGLLSVIANVPSQVGFQRGQFLYESLTIMIPRAVWQSKWELQMTNVFTNHVWGWEQGGMFVTGPGVLYLDSGIVGIIFGGCLFGGVITLCLIFSRKFIKSEWLFRFVVASTAYFSSRFLFAGGSNDVGLWQRLLLESLLIYIFVYKITPFVLRRREHRKLINGHSTN